MGIGTTGAAITMRITFVFDTPLDHTEFAANNPHLMATARAIPGFQRLETSQGFARPSQLCCGVAADRSAAERQDHQAGDTCRSRTAVLPAEPTRLERPSRQE
jgi:hypothetical protein